MNSVYPHEATVFASVCAIIFCIFGIIGNSVTILALIRCKKLRAHATTSFVLSLSVSDLIFCSFNLPITADRYIKEAWTLGDGWCKLFPVLFYANVIVSVLNMIAITINRYILISYNRYYAKFYSKTSIYVQLCVIWSISFIIMMLPLFEIWGRLGLEASTFSCTILKKNGSSPKESIFLIGFCLPCIAIITCYSCIFCRVKKSRKKLESHMASTGSARNRRREQEDRRLTKLMCIIFVCFLLSFLPLMIVNVFDKDTKYPFLHVLSSILAWMSSVINPFIYAISNRQYRHAYGKLFHILKSTVHRTESRSKRASEGTAKSLRVLTGRPRDFGDMNKNENLESKRDPEADSNLEPLK